VSTPAVRAIPEGFRTVTPYLVVKGAGRAVEFYTKAFAAREGQRTTCDRTGRVLHTTLRIGDSIIMLSDEFGEHGCRGPAAGVPSPVTIHLYVEDVDAVFDRAVRAGATPTMSVCDAFWGDRYGQLRDPFGHQWSVATHTEDLSAAEIAQRARHAFA
jgi:uncharacterized glyoxalase superfamily protein PhnB